MVQGQRLVVDSGRRLCLFEWAMLSYAAFTLLLMLLLWGRLVDPVPMLAGRIIAVAMTLGLWQLYRLKPTKLTMVLRVTGQLCLLGWWYPDTYEFNRIFLNLDYLFAGWEQSLFGCQPALLFSQQYSSPLLSELLCLGYFSYYPMIAAVALYYFWKHYDRFAYAAFVILASFFLFYVIFIFLPVAGPQFYFKAVGIDQISHGVFPNIYHYFELCQESLPIPGAEGGLFHDLVQQAHNAGERPTAAFPSSHVGISVVLLWLSWEARSRWLYVPVLVLSVLMFFATFYIQAHYAIDAIAGLFVGTAMYFLFRKIYQVSGRSL
ncbi:MAG: phosphatase PAP2 family protein [Prevotella sp.]|nr:phosphatase PAP2 family protein [Prevotella sp.]